MVLKKVRYGKGVLTSVIVTIFAPGCSIFTKYLPNINQITTDINEKQR